MMASVSKSINNTPVQLYNLWTQLIDMFPRNMNINTYTIERNLFKQR